MAVLVMPSCGMHSRNDLNGYGYFFVRLYCTGLGFQANIVQEYVLLSALQHIFAGLKSTRDQKLSSGLMSCQLIFAGLKGTRDQKLSSGLMSCQLSFAVTVSSSRNMFC